MKLIQLFAIFVGFICFQYVSAGCSSSDISKVNKCYTDYMTALRLNSGSNFNEYYNYVRNNYILVSWSGVTSLCQTFGTLQYCVKKDCMNNNDFKKVATFGGNSASDYIGNYYAFDYMCNDGNQYYYKSYDCLKGNSQNIGKYCSNYGNDCTSRKNENICVVSDATKFCGSNANAYTNSSLFTTLCHSRPECCSNGSNAIELGIGCIFALFVMHAVSKLFN